MTGYCFNQMTLSVDNHQTDIQSILIEHFLFSYDIQSIQKQQYNSKITKKKKKEMQSSNSV